MKIDKKEEEKAELIICYDDLYKIIKYNGKYYAFDFDGDYEDEWFEVELVGRLTDEEITKRNMTQDDLFDYIKANYIGEEFYGTDYLYFNLVKGE